ncbi:MAG: hypothetical protein ACD_56C00132G0005 [uncultured bacterium]|nr:MAG: hypothetical protein ACD_56C00132G0005 [uncultured bacterium]
MAYVTDMKTATAAIISRNGKYLIAKRKAGGVVGGKWEFPGGKLEKNESPRDGLARELNEELAIDAEIGEFFDEHTHRYSAGSMRIFAFMVNFYTGKIELREHDEIRWVLAGELGKVDFIGNDKPIIRKLAVMNDVELDITRKALNGQKKP